VSRRALNMLAGMSPVATQRIENGVLAVAILTAFVVTDAGWWWPLVAFLAFDLSALGYLAGPRVGATAYNAVHSYIGPAGSAIVGLVLDALAFGGGWAFFVAGLWAFHVAADRALGYGLKLVDGFTHTHLGRIGKTAMRTRGPKRGN
jgi:hypothetical protein